MDFNPPSVKELIAVGSLWTWLASVPGTLHAFPAQTLAPWGSGYPVPRCPPAPPSAALMAHGSPLWGTRRSPAALRVMPLLISGCCSSAGGRGGDACSRHQAQSAASTGADIWKGLIARPAPCLWQWPAAEALQRGERLREPPAKCAVLSVGLGDPSLPPRRAPRSVRSNYPRFGI